MRDVTPRRTQFAGAVLAGLLLAACGSGGSAASQNEILNPGPLRVLWVSCDRRDDWERNRSVEFHFSAPLSKATLNVLNGTAGAKALQIGVTTSSGRIPADGSYSFKVEGSKLRQDILIFDPTRTESSNDLGCADNPNGFEPLTTYDIDIPTQATSTKYLTSTSGDGIVLPFSSFFTTSEDYVRELDPPSYVGIDGQGALGFEPVRKPSGEIPYNSRVTVVFDEAMDPASFELGTTIQMRNETLSANVPGAFVPDLCGRSWRFVPSFSFGGGGYDIALIMTSGLKDLAGNPMLNPQTIRFRTEVKPNIPTVQVISESFNNQTNRDTVNTTADWGVLLPGTLQGGAVTTTVVNIAIQDATGTRTRVRDHPFAQTGSGNVGHDQWVFTQSMLGGASAITQVGWGPSSNALFAANHPRVTVNLGHSQSDSLSTTMDNNFDVGLPVKVADTAYTIPQRATIDPPCNADACAAGYWPLPAFTNFFEYNGRNNVILDVDAALGTNYQITRIWYGPASFANCHTFCATGQSTGVLTEPLVPDTQFTFKRRTTIAQSTFYDSGQDNPNYSAPILVPSVQTGGTSVAIEFEGAEGILFPIPGNPNNVIPDPTTFTGFVSNTDTLDGYRFVRFRVTFVANVSTGQVPLLKSVDVPYIF
jgi:hypothetical protein